MVFTQKRFYSTAQVIIRSMPSLSLVVVDPFMFGMRRKTDSSARQGKILRDNPAYIISSINLSNSNVYTRVSSSLYHSMAIILEKKLDTIQIECKQLCHSFY